MIQIIFIIVINISIPIPQKAVDLLFRNLNQDLTLIFKNTSIQLPNKIVAEEVFLYKDNVKFAKIKKLELVVGLTSLSSAHQYPIKSLKFENLTYLLNNEDNSQIELKSFRVMNFNDDSFLYSFLVKFNEVFINTRGTYKHFRFDKKNTVLSPNIFDSMDQFNILLGSNIDRVSLLGNTVLDVHISFKEKGGIYLCQRGGNAPQNKQKLISGAQVTLLLENIEPEKIRFSTLASASKIKTDLDKTKFTFSNVMFSGNNIIDMKENKIRKEYLSIFIGRTFLDGVINGYLPQIKIDRNEKKEKSLSFLTFQESESEVLLQLTDATDQKAISGKAILKPEEINLSKKRNLSNLKIFSGHQISLNLKENLSPTSHEFPTMFQARAYDLSILESKEGNFTLKGEIKDDYSLEVRNFHARVGSSEATGSYWQKWKQPLYRFLIKGTLVPTDINNWFDEWWSSTWSDFEFGLKPSFGDFSIKGEWGGPKGNSSTVGKIISNNIKYRNLPVNKSDVDLRIGEKKTVINCNYLKHSEGELQGMLTFPRRHMNSPELLSFKINGEFPLNAGRKVFGKGVEEILTNANATVLDVKARGNIAKKDSDYPNKYMDKYVIKLKSEKNASFFGLLTSKLNGEISNQENVMIGNFPQIQVAEGKASLEFKKTNKESQGFLNIKVNLKNANRFALFEMLQNQTDSRIVNRSEQKKEREPSAVPKGSLNLTFDARGPIEDYLQFEGVGFMTLREEGMGQINLLGNISKELSRLGLPVPSRAFSFDKLETPFRIQHENLFFDRMILSGPLSLLESRGSLNIVSGKIDFLSRLKLIGNLPIPIIREILGFADPISKLAEIRISGNMDNPKWDLLVNPSALIP